MHHHIARPSASYNTGTLGSRSDKPHSRCSPSGHVTNAVSAPALIKKTPGLQTGRACRAALQRAPLQLTSPLGCAAAGGFLPLLGGGLCESDAPSGLLGRGGRCCAGQALRNVVEHLRHVHVCLGARLPEEEAILVRVGLRRRTAFSSWSALRGEVCPQQGQSTSTPLSKPSARSKERIM